MAVRSAQTSQTKTKWTPIIFFSTARDNKWRGRRAGRPGQDHKLQCGQEARKPRRPGSLPATCLNYRGRVETKQIVRKQGSPDCVRLWRPESSGFCFIPMTNMP
jgi:hypothetical protein